MPGSGSTPGRQPANTNVKIMKIKRMDWGIVRLPERSFKNYLDGTVALYPIFL
jgi:hypothetical protein